MRKMPGSGDHVTDRNAAVFRVGIGSHPKIADDGGGCVSDLDNTRDAQKERHICRSCTGGARLSRPKELQWIAKRNNHGPDKQVPPKSGRDKRVPASKFLRCCRGNCDLSLFDRAKVRRPSCKQDKDTIES